jgi:hypothetical protein
MRKLKQFDKIADAYCYPANIQACENLLDLTLTLFQCPSSAFMNEMSSPGYSSPAITQP